MMDRARARRAKKKPQQAGPPTGFVGCLKNLLTKAAALLRAAVQSVTRL